MTLILSHILSQLQGDWSIIHWKGNGIIQCRGSLPYQDVAATDSAARDWRQVQQSTWTEGVGSSHHDVIKWKQFSALLALCAENSPFTGEFPSQKPVTRSFDVFYDLRLNKQLSKQSRRRWFEMPSHPFWCHCKGSPHFVVLGSILSTIFPS